MSQPSHGQPQIPCVEGDLRRLANADCRAEIFSSAANESDAASEGNGGVWRIGNMWFSVNWYGDSDDCLLRDHHRRRRCGYDRSPRHHIFATLQNGSTGSAKI